MKKMKKIINFSKNIFKKNRYAKKTVKTYRNPSKKGSKIAFHILTYKLNLCSAKKM